MPSWIYSGGDFLSHVDHAAQERHRLSAVLSAAGKIGGATMRNRAIEDAKRRGETMEERRKRQKREWMQRRAGKSNR